MNPTDTPRRRPQRWERYVATVLALVGVNIVGVSGQAMWAYGSLGHDWILAGGFAAVLESVALYLTAQASAAMLANDRSTGLRLSAYAFGLLTGAMNYAAHSGPHWHPTAMGIAFGVLSALSPWLWNIHTRRVHRDELAASGLIDPRTVHVPLALWVFYPGRAFALLRLGVALGVNHLPTLRKLLAERAAITGLDPADAVGYAIGALGRIDLHAARTWLAERGVVVDGATLDRAALIARQRGAQGLLPAPVSPAAGYVPPDHAAALAACRTNRDRIRYAIGVLGASARPADVTGWLAEHGVTVARSEASVMVKDAGASPSWAVDSGEWAALPAAPVSPATLNGHPVLAR